MIRWSLEELLPHSRTMILLDEALDADDAGATAVVRIGEDSLFYDPQIQGVPAWIGLEYMAQTVALYSGVRARWAGDPVKLGLLLGTRRYDASASSFRLGSRVIVRVAREWDDGQMAVFDCSAESGTCVASARVNVFLPNDVEAFLRGDGP